MKASMLAFLLTRQTIRTVAFSGSVYQHCRAPFVGRGLGVCMSMSRSDKNNDEGRLGDMDFEGKADSKAPDSGNKSTYPTSGKGKRKADHKSSAPENTKHHDDDLEPLEFSFFLNGQVKTLMFYGGLMGLLADHGRTGGQPVQKGDKILRWVAEYNHATPPDERDAFLRTMLRMLYQSTKAEEIPTALHPLVDMRDGLVTKRPVLIWVPFYAWLLLKRIQWTDKETRKTASQVVSLLNRFVTSDDDDWETLFVVYLLARSVNQDADGYFLSPDLFRENPRVELLMDTKDADSWAEVETVITEACQDKTGATVAIVYPETPVLGVTAIVAYLEGAKVVRKIGFRFDHDNEEWEGISVDSELDECCLVGSSEASSGTASDSTMKVASEENIFKFYGDPGEGWSPKLWRQIYATG